MPNNFLLERLYEWRPKASNQIWAHVGISWYNSIFFYFRKLQLYFVLIFRSDLLLFSFDMRYTTWFPPYRWNYLFLETTKILVITLKGNHVILLDSEILRQFYNFHLSGLIAVNQDGIIACHLKKCWTSDQWQTWSKTPYDNCVCLQVLFQCKSLWR